MRTHEGWETSKWNTAAVPRLLQAVIEAGSIARRPQPTITSGGAARLGMHRVEVAHSIANHSYCRVANKAGEPEGSRTSALLHDDGWHDMHVHRRIAAT